MRNEHGTFFAQYTAVVLGLLFLFMCDSKLSWGNFLEYAFVFCAAIVGMFFFLDIGGHATRHNRHGRRRR